MSLPESLAAALTAAGEPVSLIVACDIGGTNTRIVIRVVTVATGAEKAKVATVYQLRSTRDLLARFAELEAVAERFGVTASGAALAIAAPVVGGSSVPAIANFAGGVHSSLQKGELPPSLFPPACTRLMNDMAACAEGVLECNARGAWAEVFTTLWRPSAAGVIAAAAPGDAAGMGPCTHALVAVGTGLGNTALLHLPDLPSTPAGTGVGSWLVAPMEAGHQSICALPAHHAEFGAAAGLALRDPSGTHPAEWDDLCSGRGLEFAYSWCAARAGVPVTTRSAKDVAGAWETDPVCEAALLLHYQMIMRFTANFVIATSAEGVVLAGGNQVSNADFVLAHREELQKEFLDHSMERMSFLSRVRVWTQIDHTELAMNGAMGVAAALAAAK